MEDWLGMLITIFIFPLFMLICGKFYMNKSPQKINHFVGYRTKRAMKNNETWLFAHNYIGKIMFKMGLVLLPLSVIVMLFVKKRIEDIEIWCTIITTIQIVPILAAIALTEKALKDNFDEEGNRKNGKPAE